MMCVLCVKCVIYQQECCVVCVKCVIYEVYFVLCMQCVIYEMCDTCDKCGLMWVKYM